MLTPSLLLNTLLASTDINEIEEAFVLVEPVHKRGQAFQTGHPSVLGESDFKFFHICIYADHYIRMVRIKLKCRHVVLNSGGQFLSGKSAACFVPIKERVPELLQFKASDIVPTGTLTCHSVVVERTINLSVSAATRTRTKPRGRYE